MKKGRELTDNQWRRISIDGSRFQHFKRIKIWIKTKEGWDLDKGRRVFGWLGSAMGSSGVGAEQEGREELSKAKSRGDVI